MIEFLENNVWVIFTIIGIAFFIAWCLSKAAKDPYFDSHEDTDYSQFIDTVEIEKHNLDETQFVVSEEKAKQLSREGKLR